MTKVNDLSPETQRRRQWETPTVKTVGTVRQVLKAGGGKLSLTADDMGDAPFKPKGIG
jgi:hypothetical protein